MEPQYVRLGGTILYHNGKTHKATIDHQVDEDGEYTGCYKVSLEDGTIINVEADADGKSTEVDKGPTEISQVIGKIICEYKE